MKQYVKAGATLIGLYIIVSQGSNFGIVMQKGAEGVTSVTKALQGR